MSIWLERNFHISFIIVFHLMLCYGFEIQLSGISEFLLMILDDSQSYLGVVAVLKSSSTKSLFDSSRLVV